MNLLTLSIVVSASSARLREATARTLRRPTRWRPAFRQSHRLSLNDPVDAPAVGPIAWLGCFPSNGPLLPATTAKIGRSDRTSQPRDRLAGARRSGPMGGTAWVGRHGRGGERYGRHAVARRGGGHPPERPPHRLASARERPTCRDSQEPGRIRGPRRAARLGPRRARDDARDSAARYDRRRLEGGCRRRERSKQGVVSQIPRTARHSLAVTPASGPAASFTETKE
jgi:hypothetical protein